MNDVMGAMRFERQEFQLNQPAMSDGKKWGKNVEGHLNNLWDLCYPKLESYAKLQQQRKKRLAASKKAKLRAINERL